MQFRFPGSLSLLPSHFKDHIAGTVGNYPALPPSEWALVHKDWYHLLQSVYWSNWSKLLSITGFVLWFAKEAAAQKCWGALTQKLHCSGRINPPFSAVTDYCSEKQVRLLLVRINFCLKKEKLNKSCSNHCTDICAGASLLLLLSHSSGLFQVCMSSLTESYPCEILWYDQLI